MADRLDTICTELNLTFGQVCTELAKRGLNFEVKSFGTTVGLIKITARTDGTYRLKREILDEIYVSYSTGHDTSGYFILILAKVG